jgi:AraC-like DNA-binding protein
VVTLDQAGWRRDALVILPAPAIIADVVEYLWIDERSRAHVASHRWRVVADDAPHLIYVRFVDASRRIEGHRLHLVGARRRFVDVDCSRRQLTAGARLRPGAIPALVRADASLLTDRGEPIESFAGEPARRTLHRLETASPAQAAWHIASLIAELAQVGRALDPRARWLASADARDGRAVREVARQLGVGDRALRAWSTTHLGLGVRRFMRIRRLHRALETRFTAPSATWSTIAASAGFADQPHLVRDCRALLGESPQQFFTRAG